MHKFKCPDGHEFEAKRNFYAHCPVCGKNSKRVYDAQDDTSVTKPTETPDPITEVKPPVEDSTSPKIETKLTARKDSSVRRVKVTRDQKTEKEDDKTSKEQSPKTTPAKKVTIKRGLAPKVNKKITTTRDRKVSAEKKEERATQWRRVKAFKLF